MYLDVDLVDAVDIDHAAGLTERQNHVLDADDAPVGDDEPIVAPFDVLVGHQQAGDHQCQPEQGCPDEGIGDERPGNGPRREQQRSQPELPRKRPPVPPCHDEHVFVGALAFELAFLELRG